MEVEGPKLVVTQNLITILIYYAIGFFVESLNSDLGMGILLLTAVIVTIKIFRSGIRAKSKLLLIMSWIHAIPVVLLFIVQYVTHATITSIAYGLLTLFYIIYVVTRKKEQIN